MAKLIALCRAGWLIIVLAMIVRSTQASGFLDCLSSDNVEKADARTDDEWTRLGTACARKLSDQPIRDWLSKLKVVSKKDDCTEETRNRITYILAQRKREFKKCFDLMREYLPLYLNACGLEESFKKVINSIRDKSREKFTFIDHETLASYIEKRFLQQESSLHVYKKLPSILDAIEMFSELERISEKTACTDDLQTKLIKLLVRSGDEDLPEPQEFRKVNFALYLDKCGFEHLFKNRVEHIKQSSHLHWDSDSLSSLYKYVALVLSGELNKSDGESRLAERLNWILSVFTKLSVLESISDESQCTEELKKKLLTKLDSTRNKRYMQAIAKDYFTLYLDRCGIEKRFKKAIDNISPEYRDSNESETFETYLESEFWPRISHDKNAIPSELNEMMSIIEKLSELNGIFKKTDCTEELKDNLLMWRKSSIKFPKMLELVDAYFAHCLRSSGLEDQFKKSIDNIKQITNERQDPVRQPTLHSCFKGRIVTKEQLGWIAVAVEQLSGLRGMSETTHCTVELLKSLLEWLKKSDGGFPGFHVLLDNYLALYLAKCGYDELYKKRIHHIENSSHDEYGDTVEHSTLHSLLADRIKILAKQDVVSMLNTIKEFSALEGISEQTACTDQLQDSMIDTLIAENYGNDFNIIIRDYFALYLENCGFEQLFKARVEHIKQSSHPNSVSKLFIKLPTLYSYIAMIRSRESNRSAGSKVQAKMVTWILSVFRKLSVLESISDESQCNEELRENLLTTLDSTKNKQFMQEIAKDYFTLYTEKCGIEKRFKKAIDNIPHTQLNSDKKVTLANYLETEFWPAIGKNKNSSIELKEVMSIIERLSELNSIFKETDCTDELKDNLLKWRNSSIKLPKMHELLNGYLLLYSNKCGAP